MGAGPGARLHRADGNPRGTMGLHRAGGGLADRLLPRTGSCPVPRVQSALKARHRPVRSRGAAIARSQGREPLERELRLRFPLVVLSPRKGATDPDTQDRVFSAASPRIQQGMTVFRPLSGALGFVQGCPGARAPGYGLSPLRGSTRSTQPGIGRLSGGAAPRLRDSILRAPTSAQSSQTAPPPPASCTPSPHRPHQRPGQPQPPPPRSGTAGRLP